MLPAVHSTEFDRPSFLHQYSKMSTTIYSAMSIRHQQKQQILKVFEECLLRK